MRSLHSDPPPSRFQHTSVSHARLPRPSRLRASRSCVSGRPEVVSRERALALRTTLAPTRRLRETRDSREPVESSAKAWRRVASKRRGSTGSVPSAGTSSSSPWMPPSSVRGPLLHPSPSTAPGRRTADEKARNRVCRGGALRPRGRAPRPNRASWRRGAGACSVSSPSPQRTRSTSTACGPPCRTSASASKSSSTARTVRARVLRGVAGRTGARRRSRTPQPRLRALLAEESRRHWNGDLFENTRDLYGLIHARFILTTRGLSMMVRWSVRNDDPPRHPTPRQPPLCSFACLHARSSKSKRKASSERARGSSAAAANSSPSASATTSAPPRCVRPPLHIGLTPASWRPTGGQLS